MQFQTDQTSRQAVAQVLLSCGAVTLAPQQPYHWASGMLAPIYTDNRLTISFPEVRRKITAGLVQLITRYYPQATVIGGVATAGIPQAAWVAEALGLPMIYVRSKPKDHGAGKQIEGHLTPADQVVLIDDLISTGGSVLGAAQAVRQAGFQVLGIAAGFTYQLPEATGHFATAGLDLATVTDYPTLIELAESLGHVSRGERESLANWREDPWGWQPVVNPVTNHD